MGAPQRRATRGSAHERTASVGTALLAAAVLAGCGSSSGTGSTAERLTAAIEDAGRASGSAGGSGDGPGAGAGEVTLTDVTHVDWDRGVLVCPDDAVADVEAALGAAWRDAPPLDDDDVAHLLLSSAGAVAEDIRLDRSTIDPCARATDLADRTFGITASLEVAPASSGRGWTIRVG